MIPNVKCECPNCGYVNKLPLSNFHYGTVLPVLCDVEEGGCDEWFGVSIHEIKITPKIFTMTEVL